MDNQLLSAVDAVREMEQQWHESPSAVWGISTGFPSIDLLTGGLHPGEVTILAARTSQGKTALGGQIAFNVATDVAISGEVGRVLYFSPEMTAEQMTIRWATQISGVPSRLIKTGKADQEQRQAFHEALEILRDMAGYLWVHAGGSLDIATLLAMVEEQATLAPIRLVIVDYLQRLTSAQYRNEYDRFSHISMEIKNLTNTRNIPILMLSQLNREIEGDTKSGKPRLPRLSDIRGSGRIEEDCDNGMLIYREDTLRRQSEGVLGRTPATLIVEKSRNGQTGHVSLYFEKSLARFVDAGIDQVEL